MPLNVFFMALLYHISLVGSTAGIEAPRCVPARSSIAILPSGAIPAAMRHFAAKVQGRRMGDASGTGGTGETSGTGGSAQAHVSESHTGLTCPARLTACGMKQLAAAEWRAVVPKIGDFCSGEVWYNSWHEEEDESEGG